MKEYTFDEARMILNISEGDLKSLIELNIIPTIKRNDSYFFDCDVINKYQLKRKEREEKLECIPKCDIEMLKNDRWENDKN